MTTKPQSTKSPEEALIEPCPLRHHVHAGLAIHRTGSDPRIVCLDCGLTLRAPDWIEIYERWQSRTASAAPVVDTDAFHCENCEKSFTESPHATDDGYWLCDPCWSVLRTEAQTLSCTRAFPCRYRNARQCAHDTMLGSECPTICECACHATAAAAPVEQSIDPVGDFVDQVWNLTNDRDGWSRITLRGAVENFARQFTATPSSTSARAAAEEIAQWVKYEGCVDGRHN